MKYGLDGSISTGWKKHKNWKKPAPFGDKEKVTIKKIICKIFGHKERNIYNIFGNRIKIKCKRCHEQLAYSVYFGEWQNGVFELGEQVTSSSTGFKGIIVDDKEFLI